MAYKEFPVVNHIINLKYIPNSYNNNKKNLKKYKFTIIYNTLV